MRVAWVLLVVVEVAAAGFAARVREPSQWEHSQSQSAGQQSHVVSSIALIVASHPHVCLHVWTRGLVGWLVVPRAARCLSVSARGGCLWATWWGGGVLGVLWVRDRVGVPLVGVWVASRERACLREICGWVGDMEGVALLEELFCL